MWRRPLNGVGGAGGEPVVSESSEPGRLRKKAVGWGGRDGSAATAAVAVEEKGSAERVWVKSVQNEEDLDGDVLKGLSSEWGMMWRWKLTTPLLLLLAVILVVAMSISNTLVPIPLKDQMGILKMHHERLPHAVIVYDRFPGRFETNDEYALQIMEALKEQRWTVTLVTLMQGEGLQYENYDAVKELGVNVIMTSGSTMITTRGELKAALKILPPVSFFYIIQTFRSAGTIPPIAILRPFLIDTLVVSLNTDMHSLRTHMQNGAKRALENGLPMPSFSDRFSDRWIPTIENSQRSAINQDFEQYVLERRSLKMADRMYVTSEEIRRQNIKTLCKVYGDDCNIKNLEKRVKLITLGNPHPVFPYVKPWSDRSRLIFIGGESPVSRNNLRFFIERILPKVLKQIPTAQVDVFSKYCDENLSRIHCHDWRSDTSEALSRAVVMVYPALAGTGLHMKNWLALSRGVPVVTTEIGAIEFDRKTSGIIVANSAVGIAERCISLLLDEHKWNHYSSLALETARATSTLSAKESILDVGTLLKLKRNKQQTELLRDREIVHLNGMRLSLNTENFTIYNSADIRAESKSQKQENWINLLAKMKHQVTVYTIYPIDKAKSTNEPMLRDVGVHFVHPKNILNRKSTTDELIAIKTCLQPDVVVSVPEYTTGDRQQLYIELHKIINSLDKYKNTVRVLYNPTVQILALPYANRTTVANLARKREVLATGVTKIEFSTDSNENKILTDADPMYSRLYRYEHADYVKSDKVMFNSEIAMEKARNVFCSKHYLTKYGVEMADDCVLDGRSKLQWECVEPAEIVQANETTQATTLAQRKRLLFVGSHSCRNREGILWFLMNVFPEIQKRLPHVELTFFGDICIEVQRYSVAPGMAYIKDLTCITGTEVDLQKLVSEARVYVNPMVSFFDASARLLLPLKHGIPVVATSLGAEGYGTEGHIRIANSAGQMVDQIEQLFTDDTVWKEQSKAGTSWVFDNRNCDQTRISITSFLDEQIRPILAEKKQLE